MTTEERMKLYNDFHSGVRMLMDKITEVAQKKSTWSLCEMGTLADIMKDMAMTEKSIAKAQMYYSEHSVETY